MYKTHILIRVWLLWTTVLALGCSGNDNKNSGSNSGPSGGTGGSYESSAGSANAAHSGGTGGNASGLAGDVGGSSTAGKSTGSGGISGKTATGGNAGSNVTSIAGKGGAGAGGRSSTGGTSNAAGEGGTGQACTQFGTPSVVGHFDSSALTELSGLAASRSQPGVLFAHEDSGSSATFYALSVSGTTLGTYTLSGATATDWEDIALGPQNGSGNFIYLGDIGDNAARTGSGTPRTEISVFRVKEPSVSLDSNAGQVSLSGWERMRFQYPDSAHDAETLMVDPVTSDILIVTKETNGQSKVFRAPGSASTSAVTPLESVATLTFGTSGQSALATAGDISPTGDRVIIRTYTAILLWTRGASWSETFSAEPIQVPSPSQKQGEGLTFSADGRQWFAAGEQENPIYAGTATCP